jgi:hypothetical protein
MLFRFLLAGVAVATAVTVSEAGPLRRRFQSYDQPVYQPMTYAPPADGAAASPAPSTGTTGGYVSGYTPVAMTVAASEGDGLDEVNAARAMRGLRPFVRDEGLAQAARACAQYRASYLMAGHTSNDFGFVPAGSFARSAGCAAASSGWGWLSCCTYENYTYAGAAWVAGRDGQRYMHLFVR